jgi:translation initiation factor eIF-2B subunit gamma
MNEWKREFVHDGLLLYLVREHVHWKGQDYCTGRRGIDSFIARTVCPPRSPPIIAAAMNFSTDEKSKRKSEFQAVIMAAGDDNLLYPLTDGLARSLLPVANRSLLLFQLNLLESAGFEDVIIVIEDKHKNAIRKYIEQSKLQGLFLLKVHLVTVCDDVGTAESLRKLDKEIVGDFFVLHGDLIAEGILNEMADIHRVRNSTVTMLLKDKRASKMTAAPSMGGKKGKDEKPKRKRIRVGPNGATFFGFDRNGNRLFYKRSINDMDEETPKISIPKALLRRRPNIYITDEMEDVRLYIFSRRVLDILMFCPEISDIYEELIPKLISLQFRQSIGDFISESQSLAAELSGGGLDALSGMQDMSMGPDVKRSVSVSSRTSEMSMPENLQRTPSITDVGVGLRENMTSPSGLSEVSEDRVDVGALVSEMSSRQSAVSSRCEAQEDGSDHVRVFTHILPPDSPLFVNRLSELHHYIAMNQSLFKMRQKPETPWKRIESDKKYPKFRKDGSLIGTKVIVGEKTNVKNCVVGDYCEIGDNVKLNNCVLMNHAVVESGTVIQNSVLCSNVRVGKRCHLNKVHVGEGTQIDDGKEAENEVFTSRVADDFFQ